MILKNLLFTCDMCDNIFHDNYSSNKKMCKNNKQSTYHDNEQKQETTK